ncbi:MAG: hypothetical protein QGG40_05505 [Myxococcota bacterium]|nr:hypothetical protein [Myxococcota bacterium]
MSCTSGSSSNLQDTSETDTHVLDEPLSVLLANVGNLDEVSDGPCGVEPYRGALCLMSQEGALQENLTVIEPDVIAILEVLDADYCTEDTWDGDDDLACTDAPDRDPYQQVRRLLGRDYTVVCDGIAHYDCIGVRSERMTLDQCGAGELCMGDAETPDHPPACSEIGGKTSVSRVTGTLDDLEFTLVAAHPVNATDSEGDQCRQAQLQQAFEDLPSGSTIVAGDMNMDPYRLYDSFDSALYWHTVVGTPLESHEARFTAHSVTEDPPIPTWMDLATLDYVTSDFLTGTCQVLGEETGTTRLDGAVASMDHRAVLCQLQ